MVAAPGGGLRGPPSCCREQTCRHHHQLASLIFWKLPFSLGALSLSGLGSPSTERLSERSPLPPLPMERNFVSLDSSFSPTAVAAPLQTAPSAGPEGTHSGKKAEVKESSSSTSPSAQAAAAQSERLTAPYDRELFQAFVAAATRLFCDDEQIILADFLVSEERAFTEKDLVERLGWPERRLREVCASLEKLLFVQREQLRTLPQTARDAAGPDNEGSSRWVGESAGRVCWL